MESIQPLNQIFEGRTFHTHECIANITFVYQIKHWHIGKWRQKCIRPQPNTKGHRDHSLNAWLLTLSVCNGCSLLLCIFTERISLRELLAAAHMT